VASSGGEGREEGREEGGEQVLPENVAFEECGGLGLGAFEESGFQRTRWSHPRVIALFSEELARKMVVKNFYTQMISAGKVI
jgi:hypothetical protein